MAFIIKSVHVPQIQPEPSGLHSLNSLWFHNCFAHINNNIDDLKPQFLILIDIRERLSKVIENSMYQFKLSGYIKLLNNGFFAVPTKIIKQSNGPESCVQKRRGKSFLLEYICSWGKQKTLE